MRYLSMLLLSLFMAVSAQAEVKFVKSFGDLEVHYIVFNSTFLQPDIAAANGLVRGPKTAVVNISMIKDGQGQAGSVSGEFRNLLSQRQELKFNEVREGEAVYYLAQFNFDSREVLNFDLRVRANDGPEHELKFTQEVFPAE